MKSIDKLKHNRELTDKECIDELGRLANLYIKLNREYNLGVKEINMECIDVAIDRIKKVCYIDDVVEQEVYERTFD